MAPRSGTIQIAQTIPDEEWAAIAPLVEEIEELKRERNAVVIAHNYMTPDISHSVADYVGDSLGMAQFGAASDAEVIVLAGVHFMAETAKILSPERTVLIPDLRAGCSLASSITAADIADMRLRHPGVPVVTYVNTSAAVKAASDICCTSANARAIVESLGAPTVMLLPDQYLAKNIAAETDVEIVIWPGACEVHERFTGDDIRQIRQDYGDVVVLAHPECPPEVTAEADVVGSTSFMGAYIAKHTPKRVALITECSMADNLVIDHPEVEYVRPCNLCPHMKRITLTNIRDALANRQYEVTVPEEIIAPARRALDRMLAVGRKE
jgi:quinolinate synthase